MPVSGRFFRAAHLEDQHSRFCIFLDACPGVRWPVEHQIVGEASPQEGRQI
jgi:hypothetical protein